METSYGRNVGKWRVLDALVTLGFHYPPRAKFFRGELRQLFLLGDGHLAYPLDELVGSYAGAMGWGQFIPTSVANWARDHDGDGRIDLWNSPADIIGSVAIRRARLGKRRTGGDAHVLTANARSNRGFEPMYPLGSSRNGAMRRPMRSTGDARRPCSPSRRRAANTGSPSAIST